MKLFVRLLAVAILVSGCLLKTYAHTIKDSGKDSYPFEKADEIKVRIVPFKSIRNTILYPYIGGSGYNDHFRLPKTSLIYPKLKIFSDIRDGGPRLVTFPVNDSTTKSIPDNFDCVRLRLSTSASIILIGEEFEITIKAEYILGLETYQVALEGCNDFTLKMVFPEGFVQTGGEYYEFMGLKLDGTNRFKEIKIKGKFVSESENTCFQLLKGPKFVSPESLFIRKDIACVSPPTNIISVKNTNTPDTKAETNISKKNNTLEHSVADTPVVTVSSTTLCQGTAVTLTMSGCSGTVKWDVIDNGTAKTITGTAATFIPTVPGTYSGATYAITYVGKCYTADGQAFTSVNSPQITVTVNPPPVVIRRSTYKSNGTTTELSSVILEATGCTGGSVVWSNGVTGTSIDITNTTGTYTARCSKSGCLSLPSNSKVINTPQNFTEAYNMTYCAETFGAGFDFTWSNGYPIREPGGTYYIIQNNVTITQVNSVLSESCSSSGNSCSIPGTPGSTLGGTFKGNFTGQDYDYHTIRLHFDYSTDSDDVLFDLNVKPTISSLADNAATFCEGGRFKLTALPDKSGYNYLFTGPYESYLQPIVGVSNAMTAVKSGDNKFSVKVTIRDPSCTNSANLTVGGYKHTPNPFITISGSQCDGLLTTLTTSSSPGGGITYSYAWSNGGTGQSTQVGATGDYSVIVNANNGCSGSKTQNVQFTTPPTPTVPSSTYICPGTSTTIIATGCTGTGVSYLWSTGAVTDRITVNPSVQTTYTVSCRLNGCAKSATTTVMMNDVPSITTTSIPKCGGANLTAIASNITAYSWTGPSGYTSSLQNPTNVTLAGTYSVTATNTSGCIASKSQAATIYTIPTVTLGSVAVCGEATLTATPSVIPSVTYTYSWDNGTTYGTVNPKSVTSAGTYTVIAKTSQGCISNTASTTATIKTAVTSVTLSTPDTFCGSGTLSVTASGGSGFTYSLNGGASQASNSFTINSSGNYNITATNSEGCSATSVTKYITINPNPTVSIANAGIVCRTTSLTANASVSGGTTFTYTWNSSGTYGSSNLFTTSSSGTYSVTAKTAADCIATASATVTVLNPGDPSDIKNNANNTSVTSLTLCPNEGFSLTATCGANQTPKWYNGAALESGGATLTKSYLTNTTLTVKCSENAISSCESTGRIFQINIKTVTPPTINTPALVGICSYGSMNFSLSSNTCETGTIKWYLDNAEILGQTDPTLNNRTQQGIYKVECKNNGCNTSSSVNLKKANAIDATFTANQPICEGSTLNLNANNTTYTSVTAAYQWTGPGGYTATSATATRAAITTAQAGNYTLTANNTFGSDFGNVTCTAATTVNVAVKTKPTLSVTANKTSLCVYETLQLNCTVTNAGSLGTPLTYSWAGSGAFSSTTAQNPTVTSLVSGNKVYTVTVTAPNGCTATATIAITIIPRPTITATTPNPYICGGTTLQLNATPDPGQGAATYSWSGPNSFNSLQQNPTISDARFVHSGIYTVTVTQQCTATATVQLTVANFYEFSLASNSPVCEGSNLILGAAGGSDGYSGSFSFIIGPGVVILPGGWAMVPYPSVVSSPPAGMDQLNYQWTGPNGFVKWQTLDSRLNLTNVALNQAGVYTLSLWNSAKTCRVGEATFNVVVKPLPTKIAECVNCVATTNTTGTCLAAPNGSPKAGETLQLKASTSGTGDTFTWVGPNGFSASGQTATRPLIQLNDSGIYIMTATLNGCSKTSSVSVTVVPSCTLVISSATVTCSNLKGNITLQLCGQTPGKILLYRLERKNPITGQYDIIVNDWTSNIGILSNIDVDGDYKVRVLERIAMDSQAGTCEASPAFVVIQAKPKCNAVTLSSKNSSNVETAEVVIASNGTVAPLTLAVNGASGALAAACASTPIAYSWEGPNGFCSTVASNQIRVPGTYKVTITYGAGTATATCVLTKEITMAEKPFDVEAESVSVRCINGVSYAILFKSSTIELLEYSTDLVNWSNSYQIPLNSCRPNDEFQIFVRDKNNPTFVKTIAEVTKSDCSACPSATFYVLDPIIDCSGSTYSLSALAYNSAGGATPYNNRLNVRREDGSLVNANWVTVTNNTWYAFTGLAPGKYTIIAAPIGSDDCESSLTAEIKEQTSVTPVVYTCGGAFNVDELFGNPLSKKITYTSNNNWAGNALSFNGTNHRAFIGGTETGSNYFSEITDKFTIEAWINPDVSRVVKLFTPAQLVIGNHLGWDHQHFLGFSTAIAGKNGLGISVGINGINIVEQSLADSKQNVVISENFAFNGWAHIALVVDNTDTQRYSLYINGNLVATGLSFNSAAQTRPMSDLGTLYGHYKGLLDEYRVWKVARTTSEIQDNMSSVLTAANTNLVRNYHFDEASGKTFVDGAAKYNGTFNYSDCSFRVKSDNTLYPSEYTWTGPNILSTSGKTITVKYNQTSVTYTITYKKPDGTNCTDNITLPAPAVCSDLQIAVSPSGTILEYSGISPVLTATVSNPAELTTTSFNLGKSLPSDGFTLNNNVCVVGGDACNKFTNFTVEAWVKPTAGINISVGTAGGGTYSGDNNQKYLFRHPWTNNQDNTAGMGLSIGANGVNLLEGGKDATGNGFYRLRISYAFSTANLSKYNGWLHIAVVYQNNKPTLFVNGTSVAIAAQTFAENIMAPQAVGDMNGWGFRGLVDEVRFWGGARSDNEIFNNFTNTGAISGYEGYWKFETSSGGLVPSENASRSLNIGSTTIPATTTTISVTSLPNIVWYKGNEQVGEGAQYVIPVDEVIAGDYLYKAVFVKKDNTVCETNKIITISPQPVCPVTPGCYRIVTRHTTPARAWYPARLDNTYDGTRVMEKLGFANQTFKIVCLNGTAPEYKILSTITGQAVDIRASNAQNLEWKDNVDRNEQKFLLYPQGDGSVRISPKGNSGFAVQTGVNENDPVWMENWANSSNQKWTFEATTCPTFEDNCTATGEFTLENWDFTTTEISQNISAITQFPRWTQAADEVLIRKTDLSASMTTISGTSSNNYAMRLTGYICPPETGQYEIFVKGDDDTEFWLSTDDTPANKLKIAFANEYSPTYYTFSEQKSKVIGLVKGQKYYFEGRMFQNYGEDLLTVAWRKAGETTDPLPIPAEYLSPYERCGIKVTVFPKMDEYVIGDEINLTAIKPTAETGTPSYKWEVMPPDASDLYQNGAYVATITVPTSIGVIVKPRTAADPVTYKVSKQGDPTCFKLVRLKIKDVKCDCKEDCENLQSTFPDAADGLSLDRNFTAETTYMAEGQGSPATQVTYFDGLGRPVQVISVGTGSQKQDMVQTIQYDLYGRENLKYLAYPGAPSSNGGHFLEDLNDIRNASGARIFQGKVSEWHQANNNNNTNDANISSAVAFAESIFEKSPLNRVNKTSAPGNDVNGAAVVSFTYGTNTSGDGIKKLTYNFTTQKITVESYGLNMLFKTKTIDQKGLTTIEYKDLEGRVVCKDIDGAKTYYCYDDLRLLRCVVQPMGMASIDLMATKNAPDNQFLLYGASDLSEVIFAYDYNNRGLMIKKKVPGAAAVTMTYASDDMLETITSKINDVQVIENLVYDGLNRVVAKTIQKTGYAEVEVVRNYYDTDATLDNKVKVLDNPNHSFGVVFNTTKLKGLLVATEEKLFDSGTSGISSIGTYTTRLYFDNLGRIIRTARKNHMGGVDYTDNDLDFIGRIKQVKSETNNGALNTTMLTKSTYDAGSRVKSVCQKINGDNWQPVVRNNYNKLGQNIQATLGCKQQVVDYTYNIQGVLKSINDPTNLKNTSTVKQNEYDFFGMTLEYAADGNINKQIYNHAQRAGTLYTEPYTIAPYVTSGIPFEYTYSYDTQKRILSGILKKAGSQIFALDIPTGTSGSYDKNGNINNLKRTIGSTVVDNLTYDYNDNNLNQLSSIAENSGNVKFFKANSTYTYYNDGSLKSDNGKGITSIKNTFNRLPGEVMVGSKTMSYVYTASGIKVQTNDGNGKIYNYIGGIVYVGNQIEYVTTAAGRWLPKEQLRAYNTNKTEAGEAKFGRYEYQIKDHLGNLRVACRCLEKAEIDKASRTPNDTYAPIVVQEQHYDPWGLDIGQEVQPFVSPITTKLPDRRTYNGKEVFADHGYSEYGARWYGADNARFAQIDPLTEKFNAVTPYAYVNNNPVRLIDPTGMAWDDPFFSSHYEGEDAQKEFRKLQQKARKSDSPDDIILRGADNKEFRIKTFGEDKVFNVPINLKNNTTIDIGLENVDPSRLAVGYTIQGDGNFGFVTTGGVGIEMSVVNFTDNQYSNYNYVYAGLHENVSFGAQGTFSASAGASVFVAYNYTKDKIDPTSYSGFTGAVGVSIDAKFAVGGGANANLFDSGAWRGVSVGLSVGVGVGANFGSINGTLSNTVLLNDVKPTRRRNFVDRSFNYISPVSSALTTGAIDKIQKYLK